MSFAAFLSSTPTVKELTEHVNVSTNWYLVGTMLDLDQKRLKSIEAHPGHTDAHKMVKMFNLWLDTAPRASRRQVLEALRVDAVGEITLAQKYEKYLRKLHQETYTPPSTKAVFILERNAQSLNEALVSPVQVSQLLYCKRCISEATLDEMERIDQRRSLDDKKTTLLAAMKVTVSSDYRKLKDIATVLSDAEQTRDIGNEIMTEYEETIPQDDDSTVVQPQEAVGGNEDHASDILRNNYSALSQSITEPVRMAKWLHDEVISDEALSCIISTRGSVSDSRAVLLKAVRDAVHSNNKHLELFVTVLRKFSETAHIGDTISEEYKHNFNTGLEDVEEMETEGGNSQYASSESECSVIAEDSANQRVQLTGNVRKKFQQMRAKFGITFYDVRNIFSKKAKSKKFVDKMKTLLAYIYPDLKPELSPKKTIDGVLDVVYRNCSIVDVHPLEVLAVHFKIKEAEDIIKEYNEAAKEFCKSVSVSLSENETFQAISTRYLLCETITFVLNWNADKTTLQDVNDVLLELDLQRKYHVKVIKVGPNQSVVVTCYCPAEYTGSLIMAVLGNIEILQRKGLKEFILGNCTVWNTSQVVSENTERADMLAQIDDLKAALKDRDERIEATKAELERFKEPSGNRLKEIEDLQMNLEKSQCINVQKEKEPKQKEERSSLKEKLLENFLLLTQYLKEREEDGDVAWNENGVLLTKPSLHQFKEVISKLENKHKIMTLSKCENIEFLIPTILVRRTIKGLFIQSSFLSHDDILSFSSQLSTDKTLTALALSDGSISDNGVVALAQSLQKNETLEYLVFKNNPGITSDSAQPLAELLLTNKTLKHLYLDNTKIDTDGVLILKKSYKENKTQCELWIDGKHIEKHDVFNLV